MRNKRSRWRRGSLAKEYNEDGKYSKNGKEVRLGMATREAGRARNEGGGEADITQEEELGGGKGEEEEEEYCISWTLGVTIYITQ
jgi:hypothetical protein